MDLAALAAKRRTARAGTPPADVRNIRPSIREFERYVTTERAELAVVGELRRSDPDRGPAPAVASPVAFAKSLEEGGCYGVSVCVDEVWGGSMADLAAISAAAEVPVLARGLVLDVHDLYRMRDAGADAMVVYAALHDAPALAALRRAARSMHAEILVEVTDDASLKTALASDCTLIGIAGTGPDGAPDLAAASRRLARIPKTCVPILVGGVRTTAEITPLLPSLDAVILVEPVMAAPANPGPIAAPFTTLVD